MPLLKAGEVVDVKISMWDAEGAIGEGKGNNADPKNSDKPSQSSIQTASQTGIECLKAGLVVDALAAELRFQTFIATQPVLDPKVWGTSEQPPMNENGDSVNTEKRTAQNRLDSLREKFSQSRSNAEEGKEINTKPLGNSKKI